MNYDSFSIAQSAEFKAAMAAAGPRMQDWRPYAPRVLPSGWVTHIMTRDGGAYDNTFRRLRVLCSVRRELDEKLWMHLSVSHMKRIPTWDELTMARDIFAGREAKAIQIVAPASEHVNFCERVLHLWIPIAHSPLPDFTFGFRETI